MEQIQELQMIVAVKILKHHLVKHQVQKQKLGDWIDCPYPPADCPSVYQLWEYYTNTFKQYNYRIIPS